MRTPRNISRGVLVGLVIIALACIAPSTTIASGCTHDCGNEITKCEKGCYGTFLGCAIQAIISCWQQFPGSANRDARQACIRDEINDVCKVDLNQCLADCREVPTEEMP
jgi:hypothetical protein